MKFLTIITVFSILSLTYAVFDTNVCQYNTEVNQKAFPTIPDVFSSSIEVNIVPNKTTKMIWEVFDSTNKRAYIGEMEATGPYNNISLAGRAIYDFKNNEIIQIIPFPDNSKSCVVTNMDMSDDTFIFGDGVTSTSGFSARGAFRINDAHPAKYMGKEVLDTGMNVEHWQSCIYLSSYDATVLADWYFTDADDWNAALGVPNVPVRLVINGKANKKGAPNRDVYNVYTFSAFTDFITNIEEPMFQVDQGVICPFLKDAGGSHPIPQIAADGHFSFTSEVIQFDNVISVIKEAFDAQLGLSRYDYKPNSVGNLYSPFGDANVKEIHDFNSGLSYVIDKERGNCTVQAIGKGSFDVTVTDNNAARMKTIKEFFNLDKTQGGRQNWTFTGHRMIRGVEADIYIAERVGFPEGPGSENLQSVWEIGFVSENYITAVGDVYETNEPMYIWVKVPSLDYEVTYNIFGFDEEQPSQFRYDVQNCYTDDQKEWVSFELEGKYKDSIRNNQEEFKYFILFSLVGFFNIYPTRFANIAFDLDQADSSVLVSFILLDPPSVVGGHPTNPSIQLPSPDFLTSFEKEVNAGTFIIDTNNDQLNKFHQLRAIKDSVRHQNFERVTLTITLSAGQAAGYAIGFFVVGTILAVVIILLVNKFRSAPLPNLNLSFAPKTFNNE